MLNVIAVCLPFVYVLSVRKYIGLVSVVRNQRRQPRQPATCILIPIACTHSANSTSKTIRETFFRVEHAR